ncbi:hypothetical protein G4B88_002005 [Cannabis sativa]|uniref:Uncharacterized protein n=1 Tax=Cannabis sativa TaxID=3483 RepID=A0A7J6HEG3_CANSA|nr:hypothetical protein G4B88_002005 [Cannabis sativa]
MPQHSHWFIPQLVTNCPTKIESIESYGSKLLLGCSDGSLRIYAPESSGSDRSPTSDYHTQVLELRKEPYVLERNVAKEGGRGFVEVKEFGVPDTVKSMSWCGENICLGIRREYMILNSTNGALSEIFPSGRLAPPLVVSLPSGQLLLGKVRSLRPPYPLIQTVVLRNVRRLLRSNNSVVVALDNSVYGLFPVPLGAQIVQLTASGNFEEALALCKLLPPEDASLRAAKEGSIHIRYAHYLFDNGNYEEAMEHFLASQVDITYVLSLYSSIVLPKTSSVPEPEKLMDMSLDSSHLSRASSDMSDDMEPYHAPHLSDDESVALESKKMSHNTLMALVKFLQKKRYSIIEKATAEGTEEVVLDAVGDNFASYDSSRYKKLNKGRGNIPFSSGAREMAAVLDTALLQALLLTGQSLAALELLKGVNYCDVKICEEILQKCKNYTALLELYKSNSMHHEALKLLHQLIEDSKSNESPAELTQNFKPESIIEYLKPLCGTDPMLVLEFSMLVLESCPTQTIELFLSGNIPADLVNSYLKQHAPNMQGTYLELMLSMNENGISGNLQNEMVHIYLSEVLEWYSDLKTQQIWDEKTYSPTRKKLLSALESISGYNPEYLLKRLPVNALYEERAILLGKMNQHELALSLYVHKLHVPELALSYCDRVYESALHLPSAKSSGNIYLTLLQIYLNPKRTTKNFESRITNFVSPQTISIPKVGSAPSFKGRGRAGKKIAEIEGAEDIRVNHSSTDSSKSDGDTDEFNEEGSSTIMLDEVLDLLSKRWDRINGAQALRLLPRETKLQNLLPFLGPLLRKSSEAHRNFSVIKSLRQSESLQVKDELYNQRKAVVKITSDSMCSLCNKKIGTSVFAVYPNGKTLVHFVCFRDSQSMKAPLEKQQELIRNIYGVLCSRAENVSNFMEAGSFFGPDTRLVYKHFATLYFVFIFDRSENELAMLDLIQVFVETLDKCFRNVCELDIVLNYSKMHTILDEIVFGGQVLETSSAEVMKAVEEISKLEAASNSISLVPKSVSSWRSR